LVEILTCAKSSAGEVCIGLPRRTTSGQMRSVIVRCGEAGPIALRFGSANIASMHPLSAIQFASTEKRLAIRSSAARYRGAVKWILCLLALLLSTSCAAPLGPQAFSTTTPAFDPIAFWSGRTASWGVIENRDGSPTAIVTTSTESTPDGRDSMNMVQHVMTGGKDTVRTWHMRRLGNGQFEATANDMVGSARGTASGRTFHWTWTLATKPGDSLRNISMEQWMYLADNGTLMNRTIITKLGLRLAEVSEQFVRAK
jgi:hypothetical protein